MTTKDDLRQWFDRGIADNQDFMIVVCDDFDYEDYPVYAKAEDFQKAYKEHNGVNMQRVMEVYDLALSREAQMSERRAFHYPAGFLESDHARQAKT